MNIGVQKGQGKWDSSEEKKHSSKGYYWEN